MVDDADGDWSLFCPNEAPGLPDVFGDEFEALYTDYEAKGRARRSVKARLLWTAIMDAQVFAIPASSFWGGIFCVHFISGHVPLFPMCESPPCILVYRAHQPELQEGERRGTNLP